MGIKTADPFFFFAASSFPHFPISFSDRLKAAGSFILNGLSEKEEGNGETAAF